MSDLSTRGIEHQRRRMTSGLGSGANGMKRPTDDPTRLAGIREALTAACGDWQELTALYSILDDLDWLLALAEAKRDEDLVCSDCGSYDIRPRER